MRQRIVRGDSDDESFEALNQSYPITNFADAFNAIGGTI
jgi:hypothetical protein